jgi:two-component system NtrC family sensor kinase
MSRQSPHRILVIDDTPEIHEDFRKILCTGRLRGSPLQTLEAALFEETSFLGGQSEFELDSAYQGQEGLARVLHALQEGRPYEMAFVDVRMPPGLDGIEITPMLWKADPGLLIVICSAYSDYSWEEMFARLGTTDRMFILNKPFDRVEVLQLTHNLVERRRRRQEEDRRLADLQDSLAAQAEHLEDLSRTLQAEIAQLQRQGKGTDGV